MDILKICTHCQTSKPIKEFSKKTGERLQSRCKACFTLMLREYRVINQEAISSRRRAAYKTDPTKYNEQNKRSYRKHRTARVQAVSRYVRQKLKTDRKFKLTKIVRDRFKKALRNKYKGGSAIKNLGCSIDFLVKYLEERFAPGMSWNNYGRFGWHIDHIRPLSAFDLSDPAQVAQACHYSNLQPLWASDNLRKSNK